MRKYAKYSLEWYKSILPVGVTINDSLTDSQNQIHALYLDVDTEVYPKLIDQMGIINFIEIDMKQPPCDFYYSTGGEYVTAYQFREQNNYDNSFFNNKNDDSLFLDEAVTAEDDKYDFQEDTITMRSFKKMQR